MKLSLMRDRMYFFDPVSVDINDPFYAPEMCLNSTQYISGTEGFMDTIKSAAKAIWEFIKKALTWCKDKVMWLVRKILPGDKEATDAAKKKIDAKEKKINDLASKVAENVDKTPSGGDLNKERRDLLMRAGLVANKYGRTPFGELIRQLTKLNDDIINYNKKVATAGNEKGKAKALREIRKAELTDKKIEQVLNLSILKPGAIPKNFANILSGETRMLFVELESILRNFETSIQSKEGIEKMHQELVRMPASELTTPGAEELAKLKDPNSFEKLGNSRHSPDSVKQLLNDDVEKSRAEISKSLSDLQRVIDKVTEHCNECQSKLNSGVLNDTLAAGESPEEVRRLRGVIDSCFSDIRRYAALGTKLIAETGSLVTQYIKCVQNISADMSHVLDLIIDLAESASALFMDETMYSVNSNT